MDLENRLRDLGLHARPGEESDGVDGQVPVCVARPERTEQVATAMGAAHAAGAVTVIRGHGTKLGYGTPGAAPDLVLDLSAADRLLEHQPGDLIVRVQAGMPLASLQDALRGSGQRLGIDEPVAHSTVGGVVATNTSGPRRLHTGTARDLLIGVTIVLADGTVARSGGKVVKNVAGYDLGKLMVGSFGTLAVVTEATFRLHPLPQRSQWVSATVDADALDDVLTRLCHSQVAPAALEIDWPATASPQVAVLIEGTDDGVPERTATARSEVGDRAAVHDELTWPWSLPGAGSASGIRLKLTCRLGAVARLAAAAHEVGLHVRGSAGSGVLYAAAPDGTTVTALDRALRGLRRAAADEGGAVVVLSAPLAVRREVDVWGPVNGLAVMHRLKEQFDPRRLLAPGRFVGGI